MDDFIRIAALLGLLLVSISICFSDVSRRVIQNQKIAVVFICSLLLFTLNLGEGTSHIFALLLIVATALVGFGFKLFGGGDAKLLIAFSIALPTKLLGVALLLTAFVGGGLALIYIIKYRLQEQRVGSRTVGLPYGVAITVGFYIPILNFYM